MNTERKQRVWRTIKTALLALIITALLVLAIHSNKKILRADHDIETGALKQILAKMEAVDQNRREILEEAREENRNLREIISELRGIHNDCHRNATESFLREHRNQNAR